MLSALYVCLIFGPIGGIGPIIAFLIFGRFHRVHHSDAYMDVTTANRFHFGEIFFSSLFRIPLIDGVHAMVSGML